MLPPPSPKSPRDRAAKIFNLFQPIKSTKWLKYITQRREAEKIKNVMMSTDTMPPDESHSYFLVIKHAIERAVSVHHISPHEQMGIADSVAVTCCQVLGDSQGMIQDANIISRIHSLFAPSSVDVHLEYHYHLTLDSNRLQWCYAIGFRINNGEPMEPLESFIDDAYISRIDGKHQTNGWRSVGWFYADPDAEYSQCTITRADLQTIHDMLFGPSRVFYGTHSSSSEDFITYFQQLDPFGSYNLTLNLNLGERVTLRDTAKLLLAAVGIKFDIALVNNACDGYLKNVGDAGYLKLSSVKAGVSAAYYRKICGIPALPGDDQDDLSRMQIITFRPSMQVLPLIDESEDADGEYDLEDDCTTGGEVSLKSYIP